MSHDTRVEPRTGGLRALVLDDHFDSADTLAQLLTFWGHEPLVAYDGPAALHLARTQRPDVALLDLGLPGMNGYEVAQRLRQQPESKDMILIAVTGYGEREARRRSLVAGFAEHLVKPVEPERLRVLLARLQGRLIPGSRPMRKGRETCRFPVLKRPVADQNHEGPQ